MNECAVIWLTGPSGAGKTTLAKAFAAGVPCINLDGDEMRECISHGLGFSRADRRENNLRIARLAGILRKQMPVIISSIAPIAEVRDEISATLNPLWIYIKRDTPEKEGHFYEEPDSYPVIDHNTLNIKESLVLLFNLINPLICQKKTKVS